MPSTSLRVVLDTNVLLRGLLNSRSAAGKVLHAVETRRVLLLLSKPVVDEYAAVLTDPEVLERFPELTEKRVKLSLKRLRYHSDYCRNIKSRFKFERDPRDEKFVELAIAGSATDIVSTDEDLLSLSTHHTSAARRFRQRLPKVGVMRPDEFLSRHWEQIAT